MRNVLIRIFVRNHRNTGEARVRQAYGILAGGVGVLSNLLLFAVKLAVGSAAGSVSIVADAVNNLSDCASSVITLITFKAAGRPADERHPFGHARYEYVGALVVSLLILFIGFQLALSSLRRIIAPEPVAFSAALVAALAASILVKLWQGLFNRGVGRTIDSKALLATAADSRNDVITTAAVLFGAYVGHATGLHIDGWMGLAVAAFILVSGVRLILDTLHPLIGAAPDEAMVEALQRKILGYTSVLGLHDLIVHSYGPGRFFASVHVEVPAKQDIMLSHEIIDGIERDIARDMGIELVIHLDPLVTDDERVPRRRAQAEAMLRGIDPLLTLHDFRMTEGRRHTNLIFDVTLRPGFPLTEGELRRAIERRSLEALGEDFHCVVNIDQNYTTSRYRKKG